MTTVLKLGGSVITDKDSPETRDDDAIDRASQALQDARQAEPGDLVVVHGGGSFGHYHADRHGVATTTGTHDAEAVTEIHAAMTALDDALLAQLHEHDVPAVPVRPLSLAHRETDLRLPTGSIETMLAEGFVPVLHGDVVAHEGKGATILSGDDVVVALARSLAADRVGLCSTVPGVLDGDGEVVPRIESFEDVAKSLETSEQTDVTGGMAGKIRTLLALPTPAHIFGLDDLPAFLSGDEPGTTVYG